MLHYRQWKPDWKKFIGIMLLLTLVSASYFAGFLHGHGNIQFEKNFQPKIVNREFSKPKDVDFSLFWDVFNRLEDKFVGNLDRKKALYGAIDGLVASTKDPYSAFLEPGPSRRFLDDLNGEFEGIGTEIAVRDNVLTVISPLEDSPAAHAGLKPKDQIAKIDDQDTATMTLSESVDRIRGQSGTEVTLLVIRDRKEPFQVKIKRAKIKINSVRWSRRDDGLIHVRISQFNEETASLIDRLALELISQPAKGLIIDLRNNPGGLLESSIDVASYFIDSNKTVVFQQSKEGNKEEFKSHSVVHENLRSVPIAVLVNGGSASAAEILAGALSDHGLGKLIGEKTFGKGSVQDFHELKDGSTVRITVAKWLTPKERLINGEGLTPDVEVKLSEDDEKTGKDPQLDKAAELLLTSPK